jgi:hypothetical protein
MNNTINNIGGQQTIMQMNGTNVQRTMPAANGSLHNGSVVYTNVQAQMHNTAPTNVMPVTNGFVSLNGIIQTKYRIYTEQYPKHTPHS